MKSMQPDSIDQRNSKISQYRSINQSSQPVQMHESTQPADTYITCAEDDDEGDESHGCDHNLEAATDNLTIKRHRLNGTKMASRTSLY